MRISTRKATKPTEPKVDPSNEPTWLGSDLNATLSKCEVTEGGKKGKQIVVGLDVRIEDKFWVHLPGWLPSAADTQTDEQRLASCKLAQAKCKIGITFKGREPEKADVKIESCQLQPGLTVKFPTDPTKIFPLACIKLRIDYTQERVKFFGDHMDALVRFKAFSAKSEQQKLDIVPGDKGKKAA